MLRVKAVYALVLGVAMAAVAQAQQPMPPGMMQGPMMQAPMMQGPMLLPPVGGPAMGGPMLQGPPMVAPVSFNDGEIIANSVQQAGYGGDCGGYGDCGCGPGCGGGCGFGCGHGYGGCGACCPPPGCPVIFNGEVESTILVPNLDGNLVSGAFASPTVPALATFFSSDSELDEQDVLLSPRIWLHTQKCEWGLGVRVWYLDETEADLTPIDQLQLNIFGDYTEERLYILTSDVELTYSWHPAHSHHYGILGGGSYQVSVGLRYVDMEHDAVAFGSAILNDVVALTNGVANSEYEGFGVTSGVRGSVPLWRNTHLYWKLRGTYTNGDLLARTQTAASAVGNGDAAAGVTAAGALSDEDLTIGEVQLGIQWEHDLVCVPARCFFRTAFEYQHWEFDSPLLATSNVQVDVATIPGTIASATTSATARAPDIDLFGLSIAAGLTW